MLSIVPAYNEAGRIVRALRILRASGADPVIVIANGCRDGTEWRVRSFGDPRVEVLVWPHPLGIDIPRAVGAAVALAREVPHALWYDGDWIGDVRHELRPFIRKVEHFDVDLALWDLGVDQFPDPALNHLWNKLKKSLPFGNRLEGVHPSLGPVALSARLLRAVPLSDVAKPPTLLAHAARLGLRVEVLARCPLARLASAHRVNGHRRAVLEAVTGDTMEALCILNNRPRTRQFAGNLYIGAHRERRWDHLATLVQFIRGGA
ncbi:MAG: glycosyltransferase [Kyrpidia tusciae]|nr:glycosyltransferase [Kyrpidia tusciae]MBE3552168.1 glycosyltransferase [Kyrpidia tusciae]